MDPQTSTSIARRFLHSGERAGCGDGELATVCEQLVQEEARRSFKAGLRLARRFIDRTETSNGTLRTTALRCLARMLHLSGRHAEALPQYLKARALLRRDPVVRGRIDRILIDVYMYLGDFKAARLAARRALQTFSGPGHESDMAQTQVNYGNLLHRQDRHRAAELLYRQAAEYFAGTDNRVAYARCCYNRANTLVQMFEMATAELLYKDARAVYETAGFQLDALDCRYGLAWLWMLTGKYHEALLELDRCHREYGDAGDPRGAALCELDRSEVYLSLGLYEDALTSGRSAHRRFTSLSLRYEVSKAALFCGQAAMALGKSADARRWLRMAQDGFRKEKNIGFDGAAAVLAADLADDGRERKQWLTAARRQFRRTQLPYWEAMCDFRTAALPGHRAAALRRLAKLSAVNEVPHLFALYHTLRGDEQLRRGNRRAAIDCWQKAADRLDIVKAQLPPVELRTAFGRKQASPHLRLVSTSLESDPLWAAVWSERNKTAGLWAPLSANRSTHEQRQRVQQNLADLARQVAQTAHFIDVHGSSAGTRHGAARRMRKELLQRIRRELIEMGNGSSTLQTDCDALADAFVTLSHQIPIVQWHLQDDDLVAFVHERGSTRCQRWRGGRSRLESSLRAWRFFLEQQFTSHLVGRGDCAGNDDCLWSDLGDWLWKPLAIERDCPSVLVIPEGEVANLPWSALIVDKEVLLERHHFVIAPSLRHFLRARERRPASSDVRIFRGPDRDLAWVARETSQLRELAGRNIVEQDGVSRDDWPLAGDADIWHYSGHAVLRRDNPYYSYLELADGPMFAADFCLRDCRVNLVSLAACRSGEQVALPGEEAGGLVRSLLEMGARNVIAGYWPVADESTATWMKTFFDEYFHHGSIATSALVAARTVRDAFPYTYHWAAFAVTGAGESGGEYESSNA